MADSAVSVVFGSLMNGSAEDENCYEANGSKDVGDRGLEKKSGDIDCS